MSPEFVAGVRKMFERAQGLAVRHAPTIGGMASGALLGHILSPDNEPGKYRAHGALIGLGLGITRLRGWQKSLPAKWQVVA